MNLSAMGRGRLMGGPPTAMRGVRCPPRFVVELAAFVTKVCELQDVIQSHHVQQSQYFAAVFQSQKAFAFGHVRDGRKLSRSQKHGISGKKSVK